LDAPPKKKTRLYAQAEEQTNPYQWEFDLCNVTLGNFHYRKMSLVRDYALLLERQNEHAGFDALVSQEPRETLAEPAPVPLDEMVPIVHCDPTQASAIALARTGRNFIIQGPPGTGKSQTITNLIADFVAQGKRVLFVCEKRAAIDVVYHRLEEAGLQELCCLIHDSQDDKKEFVMDLKQTYESFLKTQENRAARVEEKRRRLLENLRGELAPLEQFDSSMQSAPPQAGLPLVHLLQRGVELRDQAAQASEALAGAACSDLPPYRTWQENRAPMERLGSLLEAIQKNTILAKHPLRHLHSRFGRQEQPLETIRKALPRADQLLDQSVGVLQVLDLPTACWNSLARAVELVAYAGKLAFLAERNLVGLLDPKSELAKKLASRRKTFSVKEEELTRWRLGTKGWRQKLSPEETKDALEQARTLEKGFWNFLKPGWWRLRGIMNRCYDFASHKVPPSWSQALEKLQREHRIQAELTALEDRARAEFSFEGPFRAFLDQTAALGEETTRLSPSLQDVHRRLLASPAGNEALVRLAALQPTLTSLNEELAGLLEDAHDLSFTHLRDEISLIEESLDEFPDFVPCLRELAQLPPPLASAARRLSLPIEQLEAATARRTIDETLRSDATLARFNGTVHGCHVEKLEQYHGQWHELNADVVRERVCRNFLEHVRVATLPHAQLTEEQKEFKTCYNRGRRELEHEFGKTMRYRSIRDLVAGDSGKVLNDLKPVWLMSPLSVSDALPLTADFDVVIFDEASQVTLEEAVPAIFRARQFLVVGDEMQLPPTQFFAARHQADDDRPLVDDAAGQEMEYDLSSNSFLNHAARKLAATMLGWHYRSRSESLISFSNAAFYQGRLLTVPEVRLPSPAATELNVADESDGAANVAAILDRPVSFHYLEHGVYQQRTNPVEARYIAQLVRGFLANGSTRSIGIIAFSEAQQGEIERALQQCALADDDFRERLEAEWEREQDGQFVGLLVKNLENIQGDERDVIILSVCYGPGPGGKMLMNFGPINQDGGERRLNVAFSRAKEHMVLVSSIRHHAITNDYNDGARALKNYIRYAEAVSVGDATTARRVLWEMNPMETARAAAAATHIVCTELTTRLHERGYEVDADVGQSVFRCNLAVRKPDETRYRLGILVDTNAYYQNASILERDVLRPRLLRNFGWNVHLVLTMDWLENPDAVMQSLEAKLEGTRKKPAAIKDAAPAGPPEGTPWKCSLEIGAEAGGKFWQIEVAGNQHTIRWGRVGTEGQSKTKIFETPKAADRDARRLRDDKLANGYVEIKEQ
jgi:predicted DNA-binding WGR domain protein/DNA polymerase III delta prime subunit